MATILIVDDEPVVLGLCARILKLGQHDVLQASGGQEALQLLENHTPDLALLDVMMPAMNGIVLASHIRRKNDMIKIVLMTGFRPREVADVTGKENPYRIMWKPFSTKSLLQMVDNVLGESGFSISASA